MSVSLLQRDKKQQMLYTKPGYPPLLSKCACFAPCRSTVMNFCPVTSALQSISNWDGSASLRMRPSILGSYPEWWRMGEECSTIEPEWNVIVCDWAPWKTPSRMDFSVPGYTIRVNSGLAATPTPENVA
eukprot:scaffold113323_cov17-Tisochrysis_lutea.AAC.1